MSEPKYMKSRFFNSQNDRIYFAEDFADYFASFIGNGVIPMDRKNNKYLDGLKVEVKEGLTLKVNPGKAIINGYYAVIDSKILPELQLAPPSNMPRIDRIVIRLDLKNRYIDLKILTGTSSIKPEPENHVRTDDYYDLVIADIYIDANIDTLTENNITDQRSNPILCGWAELNINTPAIGGSYGVPGGTIIAWYPKKDADGQYKIPKGWLVCDGNNGTPDLTERFIIGSSLDNSKQIGGSNSLYIKNDNLPNHTHSHNLSITNSGSHSHSINISRYSGSDSIMASSSPNNAKIDNAVINAGLHSHSIRGTINYTGKNKPLSINNKYYTLVYLMKI